MTSLQSRLKAIGETFAAVTPNTYHYWRPRLQAPFLEWAEDGGNGFETDNHKAEQGITGKVDYYTQTEFDPVVDQVQEAMESMEMAWELTDALYEEETNLIHYSWDWEVV